MEQGRNERSITRALKARADGLEPRFDATARTFYVPSRSGSGEHAVTLRFRRSRLIVACDCRRPGSMIEAGVTACWHGAAVCLEVAAMDLIGFEQGEWVLHESGRSVVNAVLVA